MPIKFGQFEAHLGNLECEVDLAICQCCLGDMKLAAQWECEPSNMDLTIGHCGFGKHVKSEITKWQYN
jgi:hypothetical protein